jgi:hypothetical protein
MIKTEQISEGFAVYFPKELKDNFKAVFKSAKWDFENKRWIVGTRSKTKLEEWVKLTQEVAQEVEARESESLTEIEIRQIQSQIEQIRENIELDRKRAQTYLRTINTLEKAKLELEKAKSEHQIELEQKQKHAQKCIELVSTICDLNEIKAAMNTMKRTHGKIGKAKEDFRDAQSVIKDNLDRLRNKGFDSKGLRQLWEMNFNRPDRDSVDSVEIEHILDISKYEEE